MTTIRKQYTQEFKDSAVKLLTEQGYQLSEASRNLGVSTSVLRRWRNAVNPVINDNSASTSINLNTELARLKKENYRLKLELEILKKAAVFFAIESGSGINS